ncbi:MAG TPA: prealbumin-like fold domain-containing protein [Acidimicrobiales bacterium]|nr:prealbumin-like fold domain-containing protein [Acidimicrobiales bacterium]
MTRLRRHRGTRPGIGARARRLVAAALVAGAALVLPALAGTATAASTGVCPTDVHDAHDCNLLITVGPDGSVTLSSPDGADPYDGSDDTLVGIVDDSPAPLSSISLASFADIFAFDGDGMCTYTFAEDAYCAGLPPGSSGYEGPDTTFTDIAPDQDSGTVDFTTPLRANGGSTFFSLENQLGDCGPDRVCVRVPAGTLTVSKTDTAGKPLVGGSYAVYRDTAPHAGGPVGQCTISGLDPAGRATCTSADLAALAPGVYYVDETNPPSGYSAAAETPVLVLGDATATIVDAPAPPSAPPDVTGTVPGAPGPTPTSTPPAATPPARTAAAPVPGATTVHTGEPFAGSLRIVLAAGCIGAGLVGAGLLWSGLVGSVPLRRGRHARRRLF